MSSIPANQDGTALTGPSPGPLWRTLGERQLVQPKLPKGLDAAWDVLAGRAQQLRPRRRRFLRQAAIVVERSRALQDLSDARLHERALALREVYRRGRDTRDDLLEAYALVREAARRQLGLAAHPVQVAAALAMNAGCIVELATGEGKTLAATMPAAVNGWRGRGCHVLTVNDYLAERDAQNMRPVYRRLGLTVAHIDGEMPPPQRKVAYAADITYCTNKEAAADLLRDRLMLGRMRTLSSVLMDRISGEGGTGADRLVMRGLACAIVDEADSILIDEAVTPLIISGGAPNPEQAEAYQQAAAVAAELEADRHFRVNHRYREVTLTRAGRREIAERTEDFGGLWRGARRREELVTQALTARHLFLRDQQYVIQDEKIVIVDEFTGRLMPDRTWRDGLHQAVEAKEQLEVQAAKETLARISFQRFFRLYGKLCGMTGTALEARHELWQIYHCPTVRIPTHRPCIRRQLPDRVFRRSDDRWAAVVEHVKQVHAEGRPILIGTRSVQSSEHLSKLLDEAGLEHQVLNAVRHREEAQIIAGAGQPGRITVATNMAGRGTDIKLGPGVAEKGGLHVIATERHESGRVDRQLFGRAGRQGDPGSAVAFVCTEDELVRRYAANVPAPTRRLLGRRLYNRAQRRAERLALRQRKAVLRTDDWLDENLGFAGREG